MGLAGERANGTTAIANGSTPAGDLRAEFSSAMQKKNSPTVAQAALAVSAVDPSVAAKAADKAPGEAVDEDENNAAAAGVLVAGGLLTALASTPGVENIPALAQFFPPH